MLEGSVRKDKNRVRVNVQLINAANDEHIWAEDYDRDLTDMFAIQTDLAQKIASELQAKLSPTEKAQLTRKPTENGEAYSPSCRLTTAPSKTSRSLSKPSSFTSAPFNSIQGLRWLGPSIQSWKAG